MLTHITPKQNFLYKSQKRGQQPRFFYTYKQSIITPIKNIITFIRIGRMSVGLLHDIMSPVTALLCSLSLIDKSHPHANIILDSKKNTEKIMLFIREQIDGSDQKTSFSLSETIVIILRILQHKASKHSVRITHISHGQRDIIYTKRTHISRIIMNLLSNSIDSFESSISDDRQIKIETYTTEKNIKLIIKDTGCGMSKQQLRNIFKYFYTNKEHGMGVGLPTVKRIVQKKLNGKISCKSELGKGTIFTISIPLS